MSLEQVCGCACLTSIIRFHADYRIFTACQISPILARIAESLGSEKGSMKALGGLMNGFYKEVGRTAADSKVVAQAAKELLGIK